MQHSRLYKELRARRIKRQALEILAITLLGVALVSILSLAYFIGISQILV